MSVDFFTKENVINMFKTQKILMFGDSNMRAIYKDLIWLSRYGTLIPNVHLKTKNEPSFIGDKRISHGLLTSSRNYIEVREYTKEFQLHYEFITKIYSTKFDDYIRSIKSSPNFIIINSCVWDLSRWGPNGVHDYKRNLDKTFYLLRKIFPKACIIFTTTLPISLKARGGFFTDNTQFLNAILPFSIVEANNYIANRCQKYNIDLIDLHYYMQFHADHFATDGIHWHPVAIRYINNIILTNICRKYGKPLPNNIAAFKTKTETDRREKKETKKEESKKREKKLKEKREEIKRHEARKQERRSDVFSEYNYYRDTYDFTTCNRYRR